MTAVSGSGSSIPDMSPEDFERVRLAFNKNDGGREAKRLANELPGRMTRTQQLQYDSLMQAAPLIEAGIKANPPPAPKPPVYVDYMGDRCIKNEKDVDAGAWKWVARVTAGVSLGALPILAWVGSKLGSSHCSGYLNTVFNGKMKEAEYTPQTDAAETKASLGYDPNTHASICSYYEAHEKEAIEYNGAKYLITSGGRVIVKFGKDDIRHTTFIETNKSNPDRHGQPIVNTKENNNELTRLIKSWITNGAEIESQAKDADTFVFDYKNKQVYALKGSEININDRESHDVSHEKFRGKKLEFKNPKAFWHGVTHLKDKDDNDAAVERARVSRLRTKSADNTKDPKRRLSFTLGNAKK